MDGITCLLGFIQHGEPLHGNRLAPKYRFIDFFAQTLVNVHEGSSLRTPREEWILSMKWSASAIAGMREKVWG